VSFGRPTSPPDVGTPAFHAIRQPGAHHRDGCSHEPPATSSAEPDGAQPSASGRRRAEAAAPTWSPERRPRGSLSVKDDSLSFRPREVSRGQSCRPSRMALVCRRARHGASSRPRKRFGIVLRQKRPSRRAHRSAGGLHRGVSALLDRASVRSCERRHLADQVLL
jgi:hypothetical protein